MKTLQPLARFIAENDLEKKYLRYLLDPVIYKYIACIEKKEEFNFKEELKIYNQNPSKKLRTQKALKEFIENELVKIMYLMDESPYQNAKMRERALIQRLNSLASAYDHLIDFEVAISLRQRAYSLSQKQDWINGKFEALFGLVLAYGSSRYQKGYGSYIKHLIKIFKEYVTSKKLSIYTSLTKRYFLENSIKLNAESVKEFIEELSLEISEDSPSSFKIGFEKMRQFYFWKQKNFLALHESIERSLSLSNSYSKDDFDLQIINSAIVSLYLGKSNDAYKKIQNIELSAPQGTNNWYTYLNGVVAILIHTNKYYSAYELTKIGLDHRNFKNLKQTVLEEWRILTAYVSILVKAGVISLKIGDEKLKNFRTLKFLNEVPKYSKDKNTTNATILIAHICHLIIDRKYEAVNDQIEALTKYSSRHLKKENESYRLNCFIKMLLQIPKAQFHREGARRKAKKYRDKLDEVLIRHTGQKIITELIPLPVLWDIIINSLSTKHYKG